jgi:hypothetical protein
MGVHIRQDTEAGFSHWSSHWLAGFRLAGAIPVFAFESHQLEIGLEHLHTEDLNMPDEGQVWDLDGVKEWGVFLGFAW